MLFEDLPVGMAGLYKLFGFWGVSQSILKKVLVKNLIVRHAKKYQSNGLSKLEDKVIRTHDQTRISFMKGCGLSLLTGQK